MRRYDNDDEDDDDDFDDIRTSRLRRRDSDAGPRPQSGLGIVSLIMSILCGLGMLVLVILAAVAAANQNGPVNDNDPRMVALGLALIINMGVTLIGLVLGIIGSIQPERNPLCAIFGSIFNALILLGVGGLMCVGMLAG